MKSCFSARNKECDNTVDDKTAPSTAVLIKNLCSPDEPTTSVVHRYLR